MARARRVMLADSTHYRLQIAPGNHGVDKAIASSVAEIAFLESQPQKVVRVIGQT